MDNNSIMRLLRLLWLLACLKATAAVGTEKKRRLGEQPSALKDSASRKHHRRLHPAFSKCWDVLVESSASPNSLNRDEYLLFLEKFDLTNEDQATFQDLSVDYVAMFYSAACRFDRDCADGEPSIELTLAPGPGRSAIVSLCHNILVRSITDIDFTFEVTVQYDPTTVSLDELGVCLESAVTSTVLESLGCADSAGRKLASLEEEAASHGRIQDNPSTEDYNDDSNNNNNNRPNSPIVTEQDLLDLDDYFVNWPFDGTNEESVRMLDSDGSCPFELSTRLVAEDSFFLNCLHQEGKCGQAVLNVGVRTTQLLAPYADQLQHAIAKALHLAVDGETFQEFFPSFCGEGNA